MVMRLDNVKVLDDSAGLGQIKAIDTSALLVPDGDPEAPEKFQDPIYSCFGTGPDRGIDYRWLAWHLDGDGQTTANVPLGAFHYKGRSFWPKIEIGYEYLSGVPNTPRARIKKIRQKVIDHRAANPVPPMKENASAAQPLEGYRYASYVGIEQMATSIRTKYGNVKAVLDAMPSYTREQAEYVVSELYKASGAADSYATVRTATKNIVPVAIAIGRAVQQAIGIATSDISDEEKAYLGAQAVADIVGLVPVYGTFVKAAMQVVLSFWGSALEKEKAQAEEYARVAGELITGVMKRTSDIGMPVPIHAVWATALYFSPSSKITVNPSEYLPYGFKGSPWQLPTYEALLHSLDVFEGKAKNEKGEIVGGLTSGQRDAIKKWWATATMFMSDPEVYDVFDALGRDAFDGTVGSDEQVLMVAAPIAVSRGWNVDKFAMKLHEMSKGWRGETEGLVRSQNRDYSDNTRQRDTWFDIHEIERNGMGSTKAEGPFTAPIFDYEWKFCRDASNPPVQNAWWLNLAALSRDALKLAETYEEKKVAGGASESASGGLGTIALPAAAGVAAAFMFGGPIGIAVGLGALLLTSMTKK